jgi:hypothetical protein
MSPIKLVQTPNSFEPSEKTVMGKDAAVLLWDAYASFISNVV